MQLFDGNYNHRDTIGTPKHELSAWETGLSERWYILVDLFFLVKLCYSWIIPDNII